MKMVDRKMAIFVLLYAITLFGVHGYTYNSNYITYEEGDCKLIFSVPHGGNEQPSEIPDRTVCATSDKPYRGCLLSNNECDFSHEDVNGDPYTEEFCKCNETPEEEKCEVKHLKDSYTKTIAEGVKEKIFDLTSKTPYIIINELKRNKMDGNRDKPEATFGVTEAETAWETYHERIDAARNTIDAHALVLDFHGQTHSEGWTEFGYTLTKSQLNSATPDPEDSTICKLVNARCGSSSHSACFESILRGNRSLGYFLEQIQDENGNEYSTVPSVVNTSPGNGNYYSGGYNTKRYGSEDCDASDKTDAIQIEMPKVQRKESVPRAHYIVSLAEAIVDFMNTNYPGWTD